MQMRVEAVHPLAMPSGSLLCCEPGASRCAEAGYAIGAYLGGHDHGDCSDCASDACCCRRCANGACWAVLVPVGCSYCAAVACCHADCVGARGYCFDYASEGVGSHSVWPCCGTGADLMVVLSEHETTSDHPRGAPFSWKR